MTPSELNPAIQSDADTVNGEAILAAHVQPVNPRDEAMAAIAESRRAAQQEPPNEGVVLGGQTAATEQPAPVDDQLAAQLGDDERSTVLDLEALKDKRVKVKIDGVEREVALSQVVRNFQKDGAADNRLRDANEALRRAKELEDRLAQREAPVAQEPTPKPSSPEESVAARKKFLDAMFRGDEEAAGTAFDEAVAAVAGRGNTTTLDPDAIIKQALPALKQQMDIDSALTEFRSKYASIDADPYLAQRAADSARQKIADGLSHREALLEAGAETLDWIRGITSVPATENTTATTQQMTDRQTRKQSHSESIVTGAAGKVGSEQPKPLTRAEELNQMRASRGQATG
jgi:hypothetical protein